MATDLGHFGQNSSRQEADLDWSQNNPTGAAEGIDEPPFDQLTGGRKDTLPA